MCEQRGETRATVAGGGGFPSSPATCRSASPTVGYVQSPAPQVPTPRRRLLVVEDEPLTSTLLVEMLSAAGFLVEAAPDVIEARAVVREWDPDCVLIDIGLGPGPTGADLAFALSQERPDIALLFLTRHPDLRTAGLSEEDVPPHCGFVRKDLVSNREYLLEAIDQVLRDQPCDVRHDNDPSRPLGNLTEHQLEILRLIALGCTNESIARMKNAGRSTVERWVAGILRAMNIEPSSQVNPRVEAVRQYIAAAGIPERS